MSQNILKYFRFEHLPPNLQLVSKLFSDFAHDMYGKLPEGSEKTVMFRKLLEAKDCAVRAYLEHA